MNIIRKLMCTSLAVMMLTAAGCSKTEENSTAVGEDTSLQDVMDAGKLVLGLDPTFKPMGYTDENDQIVGFDIDIAEEVCSRMGIKLETCSVNWTTKEEDLNAGTIDCIWNGLSISDERKQVMLMSEPYMNNDMIFVVNDKSEIQSLSDLAGLKIGVQNGSTAQEILEESDVVVKDGAVVMGLGTNVEALQQMELNMVDAVFLDSVVANYEIASTGKAYRILDEGLQSEQYAVGFKLGSEALCDKIEEELKEMTEDGTMAKISTEWFGSDVTSFGK